MHRLIYVDAGWAREPGHQDRDEAEWAQLFLAPHTNPQPPLVAWRAGRPVGVALTRVFSDGTGWVSQLAVADSARGAGLGRTLLVEALRRLQAAGATRLALGVQASNLGALSLYTSTGLQVEREYRYLTAPDATRNTTGPGRVEDV